MPEIDAAHFLEELRFDIREQDMIKAKLVLSKINAVDESVSKMALFELNRADDTFAIPLIVNLIAEYRDLAQAYPQFKEILYAKALYHPEISLLGDSISAGTPIAFPTRRPSSLHRRKWVFASIQDFALTKLRTLRFDSSRKSSAWRVFFSFQI